MPLHKFTHYVILVMLTLKPSSRDVTSFDHKRNNLAFHYYYSYSVRYAKQFRKQLPAKITKTEFKNQTDRIQIQCRVYSHNVTLSQMAWSIYDL